MARREHELTWLFDAIDAIEKGVRLEDVLAHIYSGFRGLIPYKRIGCAFLRDGGRVLDAHWCRSELGPLQIDAGYNRPIAGSSLEAVLATGQPRIINDLPAYLKAKPQSDATRRIVAEGGRSSLTCPLIVDGVPFGFLFFTHDEVNAYKPEHQGLFRQIASQVSAAISKSRAFEELLSSNRRLVTQTQELQAAASTDALTGVLNRRALEDRLAHAWAELRGRGRPFAVVSVDIDHFKEVNDRFGHDVGDQVLQGIASRLVSHTRTGDVFGRYGGEEFLMIMHDCDDRAQVQEVCERIRRSVAETPFTAAKLPVTASLGAALASPAITPTELLGRADRALYAAKHGGRNTVAVFDPGADF
jgi:diguanylate cyclase (GGDEF)-like protein